MPKIDVLATKPRTPPQVQPHLTLVMSRQLDDLEPTPARVNPSR